MSKNSTKAKPQVEATESSERPATAAAPVASTAASESTTAESTVGDVDTSGINTGAETRAAEISVAGTKAVTEKAPKKDAFSPNVNLRTELLALTNAALLERARDKLKPVEIADSRVFIIDRSHGLTDRIVGSDLSRSNIRSAVIDFLSSRDEESAPGWAIASYMHLAAGESGVGVYKGKFDLGYLAARGLDVRRGMVSRGQLKLGGTVPAPGTVEKTPESTGLVETTAAHDPETVEEPSKDLPIQEDVAPESTPATEAED